MRTATVASIAIILPWLVAAQGPVPGDARRGEDVLRQEGCVNCHSVRGQGGKIGPDLSRMVARDFTPSQMASLMWNHAPTMWSAMDKAGVTRGSLSEQQAADLFAYFYSLRYFENPGDAGRGRRVFESKRCAECHGITTRLASGAPPLSTWPSVADPIELAGAMWNHAPRMTKALADKKVPWPALTTQEMTDLALYVRTTAKARDSLFSTGSAQSGAKVYEAKGCGGCHKGNLELTRRLQRHTMSEMAAGLWNHGAKIKSMPQITPPEMRDLAAYLFSIQYFEGPGDPARGARVFKEKGCGNCHGRADSGAPSLTAVAGKFNSIAAVAALWRHGPGMLTEMRRQKQTWPRFVNDEFQHLVAFLNTPSQ
jgi:cytochrome c2